MCEQPTNDIELVIPRENLLPFLSTDLRVRDLDDLGVILKYVCETFSAKNLLPQIIRLEAIRIRWIPRTIVPAFIEWKKPRGLALQLGAELHFTVIDREVRYAPAKLEQQLARITVPLVLLYLMFDRLAWRIRGNKPEPSAPDPSPAE